MTRIVLADDEALMRSGLRMILEGAADLHVVGEAEDGLAAVEVIVETQPDVALIDLRMPLMDGVGVISQCRQRAPKVHCLVLTTFDIDDQVVAALRAGAAGFLLKTTRPARLQEAVRAVVDGDLPLSPPLARRVINAYLAEEPRTPAPGLEQLTPRELQILLLVADGLSNAEIATELYLGHTTVKSHLSHLLTKLGLRNRIQAVVYAHNHGLLPHKP